jgi:hypothetical protein
MAMNIVADYTLRHDVQFPQHNLIVKTPSITRLRWLSILLMMFFSSTAQASDYTLVFDNFTPRQVNQIMVYATRFSEFEQYEILHQRSSDTSMHYQSEIASQLLSYNFGQTFDEVQWEVITQQQGNEFQFTFVRKKPQEIPFSVW